MSPAKIQEANALIGRASTVVVSGPRPARNRPLQALALASLVIAASAIGTEEAQAQYRGHDRNQTISAQEFNRYETLSVNEASIGEVLSVNRAEVAPKGGLSNRGILGAVLGGAAGNQVGGGNGRKITTALGALGGAILGNRSNRKANQEEAVEVFVRVPVTDRRGNVEGQQIISIVQSDDQDIRPGDQVYVVGSGRKLRIVPMASDVAPRGAEITDQAPSATPANQTIENQEESQPKGLMARWRALRNGGNNDNVADNNTIEAGTEPRRPRPR